MQHRTFGYFRLLDQMWLVRQRVLALDLVTVDSVVVGSTHPMDFDYVGLIELGSAMVGSMPVDNLGHA
jgi:hypothetical protein